MFEAEKSLLKRVKEKESGINGLTNEQKLASYDDHIIRSWKNHLQYHRLEAAVYQANLIIYSDPEYPYLVYKVRCRTCKEKLIRSIRSWLLKLNVVKYFREKYYLRKKYYAR